jgi:hypothetical protein
MSLTHAALYGWPYLGLVLAVVLCVVLFREPHSSGSRWRAPRFLLPLVFPMYLVHQFEEHGIDALGEWYAFLGTMCRTLGYPAIEGCPADAAFVFSVNCIACWFAFSLAVIYRERRPVVAACVWGIPLVNGLIHLGTSVGTGIYNPGLVTPRRIGAAPGAWSARRGHAAGGEWRQWRVAARPRLERTHARRPGGVDSRRARKGQAVTVR